ncbi:MAG: hypothetical protein AAF449_12230, partial [Myxococcota bacterium]
MIRLTIATLLVSGCVQDITVLTSDGGIYADAFIEPIVPPSDAGIPIFPQYIFGRRLATGLDHGCAIRNDGVLRCWGLNNHGQLGVGDRQTRSEPIDLPGLWFEVSANGNATCGIQQDGSLWCWGQNREGGLGQNDTADRVTPTKVVFSGNIKQVAVGGDHVCAQTESDRLYCWGANREGQIGQQDT